MKIFIFILTVITTSLSAQTLEQRLSVNQSPYRHVPLGAVAGAFGTIVGSAIAGKPGGVAGGVLASVASSLLVRGRTDAITSLHTVSAGMIVTAGLTIGLNKKKKRGPSVDCFKF